MKNFKEMLDKDLDRTFYNTEEFAELQRVRIDGIDRNGCSRSTPTNAIRGPCTGYIPKVACSTHPII